MEKKLPPACAEIGQTLQPVFSGAPQVSSAVIFGSLATGENSEKSAIDIAVLVKDPSNFSFVTGLISMATAAALCAATMLI